MLCLPILPSFFRSFICNKRKQKDDFNHADALYIERERDREPCSWLNLYRDISFLVSQNKWLGKLIRVLLPPLPCCKRGLGNWKKWRKWDRRKLSWEYCPNPKNVTVHPSCITSPYINLALARNTRYLLLSRIANFLSPSSRIHKSSPRVFGELRSNVAAFRRSLTRPRFVLRQSRSIIPTLISILLYICKRTSTFDAMQIMST